MADGAVAPRGNGQPWSHRPKPQQAFYAKQPYLLFTLKHSIVCQLRTCINVDSWNIFLQYMEQVASASLIIKCVSDVFDNDVKSGILFFAFVTIIMHSTSLFILYLQIQITSTNKTKDGLCHSLDPSLQPIPRPQGDPNNNRAPISSRRYLWTTIRIIMDLSRLHPTTTHSHSSNFPSRWVQLVTYCNPS